MSLTFWMVGDWPKALVYVTIIVCATAFMITTIRAIK